ncbi:ABC-type transport system permease protein (probable substrate branched-chain amino acids) (plasmid) [Natronomonas pharaonis DSM 2160]|uniref:ABC-type transport system permease protein (Probable substrate branched-chain amino acids) n=1 Tax=Natronomonas pharaonis (strain ATCC 35678 / DSM 2160 / CIP 103997 / JCM 8858 / NBRC 14720 / NCIMB 2260 / Gabara) TaxID=348780 RepID=Q3ILZ3_NATPD|nr:branched-chain amino acid ABC transporter permease [Natronomonas pharaonis]CAI50876.1 ABC-type transport system permease protein (probable substrate branched-chain amino acids) [Natronomonas pharaonis DSM 2160]
MDLLIQTIINGLLLGGIYISVGIGFALVFGVLEVIDFAVGEYVMVGAFAGSILAVTVGVDALFLAPVIFVLFYIVGFFVQPFLHHVTTSDVPMPVLMALVFTFGIAFFARGGVLTTFGPNTREVPTEIATGGITLSSIGTIPTARLITGIFGVVAVSAFLYYLYNTDGGLAIRAIAEDRTDARLMGINIARYQSVAYGMYAGLTATAGLFIGIVFSADPGMGMQYTAFAFFMVVLAGMGYLPGIIVSGLLLGLAQTMFSTYVSGAWVFFVLFGIVYVVLLVSPQGILGRGEPVS